MRITARGAARAAAARSAAAGAISLALLAAPIPARVLAPAARATAAEPPAPAKARAPVATAVSAARAPVATPASAAPAASAAPRAAATPAAVLEGWIDGVVGAPVAGGSVTVGGWAADLRGGAPVAKVEVLLDGRAVATASLGVPRPDVARVVGREDYARSGWNATIVLAGVEPGKHRLTAVAHDGAGRAQALDGEQTIEVKAAPAK